MITYQCVSIEIVEYADVFSSSFNLGFASDLRRIKNHTCVCTQTVQYEKC